MKFFVSLPVFIFLRPLVYTKDVPALTTLTQVTYITLQISHPNIYTKRNTIKLFNQSAPWYLSESFSFIELFIKLDMCTTKGS